VAAPRVLRLTWPLLRLLVTGSLCTWRNVMYPVIPLQIAAAFIGRGSKSNTRSRDSIPTDHAPLYLFPVIACPAILTTYGSAWPGAACWPDPVLFRIRSAAALAKLTYVTSPQRKGARMQKGVANRCYWLFVYAIPAHLDAPCLCIAAPLENWFDKPTLQNFKKLTVPTECSRRNSNNTRMIRNGRCFRGVGWKYGFGAPCSLYDCIKRGLWGHVDQVAYTATHWRHLWIFETPEWLLITRTKPAVRLDSL